MDRYKLSDKENPVFDQIKKLLLTLNDSSQHNVVRKVVHELDREMVRPGTARTAAAVAGSTARILSEGQDVRRSSVKTDKKKEPRGYPEAFTNLQEVKDLLKSQVDIKSTLSDPPTEDEKTSLREASKAVRDRWCLFQAEKKAEQSST